MKNLNYTTKQIAEYINENVNLVPNSNYTVYDGPNGLTHTTGSMEYRDEDHKVVMTFITMDEIPESIEEITDSVEFQIA